MSDTRGVREPLRPEYAWGRLRWQDSLAERLRFTPTRVGTTWSSKFGVGHVRFTPTQCRLDLAQRHAEHPVEPFRKALPIWVPLRTAAANLKSESASWRMVNRPESVQLRNHPGDATARRPLILRPKRPPKPGEKVKAIHGFIKPAAGVSSQQPQLAGLQMPEDLDVSFSWTHSRPPSRAIFQCRLAWAACPVSSSRPLSASEAQRW